MLGFKNKTPDNSEKKLLKIKNAKSLKDIEDILKCEGFSKSEILTCISKIKELSSNRDPSEVRDLPEDPSVSDLQTNFKEKLIKLQQTLNKTGK